MELPLLDKESVKNSKASMMSKNRKKSTKHSQAPPVNPYLEATKELEREIENRASKAIILNEKPRDSITVTERDFFDATSKPGMIDIPSNQQQHHVPHVRASSDMMHFDGEA